MTIIAKYSVISKPVTNILHEKSMELYKVQKHVEALLEIFESNRINAIKN